MLDELKSNLAEALDSCRAALVNLAIHFAPEDTSAARRALEALEDFDDYRINAESRLGSVLDIEARERPVVEPLRN